MFFCIVQLLFPWLRPESGRPDACFFYCMKGEYNLEIINNCMHLLVGSKMFVVVQIFHKIGFSKLDYPTHIW